MLAIHLLEVILGKERRNETRNYDRHIYPDVRSASGLPGHQTAERNDAHLRVTTDLQAFALIVTAEPYAAVRRPGDVVVLENQVRPDTTGKIEEVTARYELMPRGHYSWLVPDTLESSASNTPKVSMHKY